MRLDGRFELSDEVLAHYEMWAQKPASRLEIVPFLWPTRTRCVPQATRITYASDKWASAGQETKYIHRFDCPETLLFLPSEPAPASLRDFMDSLRLRQPPPPPTTQEFTLLGYSLHVEFRTHARGPLRYWAWSDADRPILAVEPSRDNVLLLVWKDQPCWILTSPILRVTPRGIVH